MVRLTFETPLGSFGLEASDQGLTRAAFMAEAQAAEWRCPGGDHPVLEATRVQLGEWFAGQRHRFELPLAPLGTPFQHSVWQQLRSLGFGATTSYGALAASLGRPTAVRAVAAALGCNPLLLIVPCHRVIGRDGALTGYAGGLERKRALLEFEAGVLARSGVNPAG